MGCMYRILAILCVFWSLVLAPAFCLAGALEHECDGSCTEPFPDNHHHGDQSTCGHEAGCQGDPCAKVVTPSRGSAQEEDVLVGAATVVHMQAPNSQSATFAVTAAGLPASSHHLTDRPFSDRGLPLLN